MRLWPYYTNVYYKYTHGSFNIDNENYYYYLNNIAHKIIVNTFFRRKRCWKKKFGVCLLKTTKHVAMAFIFQENCMWKETWNSEILSQFRK
jgi:hypothetical protein